MATTETDADGQSRWNVFRKRVNELGWIEDRNLRFDIRWAGGNVERFREYAAALALAKPDVIWLMQLLPPQRYYARHVPYRSYLYGYPIRLVRVSLRTWHGLMAM